MSLGELLLRSLPSIPEITPGARLPVLIANAVAQLNDCLMSNDVVVVAQKVVSKAENRFARLSDIQPSERARELGRQCDKDPRLVELILSESKEVLRVRPGVIVVVHRLGFVLANAGIDSSNVSFDGDGAERVLLLPIDPDTSCRTFRAELREITGADVGLIINDSLGRAWRNGTIGTALGASGLPALLDMRGRPDRFGRKLQTTEVGLADELASAASLLMGQADEGIPAVLVRGLSFERRTGTGAELIRPKHMDMFR